MGPFLSTSLASGYLADYTDYFLNFVPGSDLLLGRCARDLNIKLVDIPSLGYWGGDYLPGTDDWEHYWSNNSAWREGLPEGPHIWERPAVFHKLTEASQFRS